ncbi:unnamed protein product [Brassica oleracea]|uniref:(rape) hypothetical protein n=1 Tax=Brassica napus TaxID=3708 RepID=A0A816IK29_BRANA|nr:unnamed protein product [Brassica napus]
MKTEKIAFRFVEENRSLGLDLYNGMRKPRSRESYGGEAIANNRLTRMKGLLNLDTTYIYKRCSHSSKDALPLAIVESKYAAIAKIVSDKDDFFTHTPRKTIAQMKETKQGSEGVFHDMDTQSDAPEASLANQGSASEQSESFDLTPAKRVRAVDIELEEINDQNSVTRSTGSMMIKKEKFAKSG